MRLERVLPAVVATGAVLLGACGPAHSSERKISSVQRMPGVFRTVDRLPSVEQVNPQEFLLYVDQYIDPFLAYENPDFNHVLTRLRRGEPSSYFSQLKQTHEYHILNGGGVIFKEQIYRKNGSNIVCFQGRFTDAKQLTEYSAAETNEAISDEKLEEYAQLLLRFKNLPIQGKVYSADINEGEIPLQTFVGNTFLKNGIEVILTANSRGDVANCVIEH